MGDRNDLSTIDTQPDSQQWFVSSVVQIGFYIFVGILSILIWMIIDRYILPKIQSPTQEKCAGLKTQPGKPSVIASTKDHLIIGWDPPSSLFEDYNYQLRYKEDNTDMSWRLYPETVVRPVCTICDLKPGTCYVFQVQMTDEQNVGPYSEPSDPIKMMDSAADDASDLLSDGNPNEDKPLDAEQTHTVGASNVPTSQTETTGSPKTSEIKGDKSAGVHLMKKELTQPGKPSVIANTKDHLIIGWDPPTSLFEDYNYQLRYKEDNTDMNWRLYPETVVRTVCTICDLKPGTCYVFQVRMTDEQNAGPYSKPSDPIKMMDSAAIQEETNESDDCTKSSDIYPGPQVVKREMTQPGKPSVNTKTIDHVVIGWDPPKTLYKDHSYQLRYKEYNTKMKWQFYSETVDSPVCSIRNLKSGTCYVFQVRMTDDENEGPYSEPSDPIKTSVSAAEHTLQFMIDVWCPKNGMPLKQLPLREIKSARNTRGKTRKLYIGDNTGPWTKEKTILLIGATGAGKSTLVDGMMNYIFGVKWSDPYRLKLVDLEEDELKNENQAVSQTQWITCYSINPFEGGRLDYKLNIIDTPGFGEKRGRDSDKEILKQIKEFISRDDDAGVVFIDAICFIIKATDDRLTATQMYIFSAAMSLLGQDIEHNILMLITFADSKQPPLLSALKKANLPYEEYFPFNNSGIYASNSSCSESEFSSLFWNMNCKSFEKFFERLSRMETKSLRQTREVLSQRERIELTMENLVPLVDSGLNKLEETRKEIGLLNDFKSQIEANKDFTYTVTETQQQQIDLPKGQYTINCQNCHFTCQESCTFGNDEDLRNCGVMRNGYCTQCPDKCKWDIHRNTPYIFKYISVTKEKTFAEKLEKYRRAEGETMTREKVVERMHEEMCDIEEEILDLMSKINECNNVLRQIALRPDPLSLVEHIDILIESEKLDKRTGFQERIASLNECRRKATIFNDVNRFGAGLTATRTTITVDPPIKRERKKRTGVFVFSDKRFNEAV